MIHNGTGETLNIRFRPRIGHVLFFFYICMTVEIFGALTVVDFSRAGEVSRFTPDNETLTAVTSSIGPAMRVVTSVGGVHPSALIVSSTGWNLSAFGELTFKVTNLNAEPLTVLCLLKGPHPLYPVVVTKTYTLALQGSGSGTFRISLTPTLLSNLYDAAYFAGMPAPRMQGAGPLAAGGTAPGTAFGDIPAALDRITDILIYTIASSSRVARYEVGNIVATGTPGSFPVAAFPFIDRFGQFMNKDWPLKTHCTEELIWFREQEVNDLAANPKPVSWDSWGGWQDGPARAATGAFRTEKVNGKWYFVDPNGKLFFSHGFNNVNDGNWTALTGRDTWFEEKPAYDAEFYNSTGLNLFRYVIKQKYGSNYSTDYSDTCLKRLPSWGFNTIGNWSQPSIYNQRRVPYIATISTASAVRLTNISGAVPASFPDVFNSSFSNALVAQMQSAVITTSRDDPWCIGYYVDNEMPWKTSTTTPDVAAAEVVQAYDALRGPATQAAKIALVNDLQAKYTAVSALNAQWNTSYASWNDVLNLNPPAYNTGMYADLYAFNGKTATKYFSTVSNVIKSLAPNRLYLGCRFALLTWHAAQAAGRYCDVVSFNVYAKLWTNSGSITYQVAGDKPYIISEFHFGSLDRGLFTPGLVPSWNQTGRALSYSNYVVGALTNNNLVGCHWFEFIDQPVTGRWHDGENRQCGFIDNCDTVYPEMVAASRGLSKTMYTLRYNSGLSPDQIPPEITGAPGSVLTNKSFTVNLDVDKNFGYWSTNASAFQQFTTAGTSLVIDRTTTLRVYGASNTVSSVTDTFVYTFDTTPPAVSGMPAGMTTNRSFTINLDVNENSGYWSTNGSAFMPFTTNGVVIPIDRTTTLRSYGRDALGNNGTTNTQTYTVIKCDLVVDSISWSPSAPRPGDAVTFSGVLSNAGLFASPLTNHAVTFWVDGVSLSYGVRMTNLLPGQKIVVDASSAVWTATAGTHTIRAMADDADRIQEDNEGNNNRTNYLDMEAPVITGAPASFTTNKSFSVTLAVSENYGYWSTNGSPFTQFTAGGTSFPVAATTTLRYYGRDPIGNNSVTNTRTYTVDGRIPDSPGSCTANAGANAVVLSWVDLATNETAYRIYRSVDGTAYSFIGTAPANAARYTNDGLACGMTYYYRIAATNAYGESLTGPLTVLTVPRLAVSGGMIELVPASNIVRYTCTLAKDCVEPAAVLFRISPSGSNSFLSLGGTMRGLMQIPSSGTYTYEWTPPAGIDTSVTYDLFTELQTSGTSSTPHIVSNIDLSRMIAVQSDLERVFVMNNPSRGSTPVVFANLSRDASVQIYSVSGRSVAALLAESNGTARWNLTAHNGRRVAPGVYICRIASATGEKIVKVIVR